ncbi:phosphoethanolamine--lipid A transferase [Pseudomonas sp. R1-18]|uniref:phosphoethanolamine transferase n=1 Tax=Pseudomonas sp. R1-18 TaxID=1632772 RepID=UPI003DA80BA2
MLSIKPVRAELVTALASCFLLLGFNSLLWRHILAIVDSGFAGMLLILAFGVMVASLFNIVISLFAFRGLLKPVLITLFMISAGVTYFMSQYGVVIDTGMLRSFVETNATEVRDLLSPRLLGYLLVLGILPSLLLWKTPVHYRHWHRELVTKASVCAGCLVVICTLAILNYQGLASLFRNHHELRLMVVPSNYLGASVGYLREQVVTARKPFQRIGEDAALSGEWKRHTRKSLTVLVVGESARAENFGILGYSRDTTMQLRQEQGLISFSNVTSCGTETAVSVPSMFSGMGRRNYDASTAKNQEGLLDVLKRAGLDVVWRDNQSGCKGVCDRVRFEDVSHSTDTEMCADDECRDEILLKGLQQFIDHLDNDTVLVLHQMGSHGPAYFKRYPRQFERFTPVCESNALDQCTRQSIINGYDNTLLYTDQVLASLVRILRNNQQKIDTAMLYISDHGESLGEYNLFLHGTPYVLAPDQQKHVPMLAWFSDGYQRSFAVDTQCLQRSRNTALSQDNLFHSMLGLLQVDARIHDPALDIFAGCRRAPVDTALSAR